MARKTYNLYMTVMFSYHLAHAFMFATYVVFLSERGMDLMQVNLINFFFMVSVFLLEMPTGAFADVFGRKQSIVIGCLFFSAASVVYYISGSFWMFVLAEIIAAFSQAFLSGAMEAWAVDSLKHHKWDGDMNHMFRRASQARQVGVIIGAIIGAWAGDIDIALPWIMGAVVCIFVAMFCQAFIREDYFVKQPVGWSLAPIKRTAKDSIAFGWKNKAIMYVIAFDFLLIFSVQSFNMYWSLVFKDTYGLSVASLGWIFLFISIAVMLGNQLAIHFKSVFKKDSAAIVLTQIVTIFGMIISASMLNFPFVFTGFLVHEIGRGMIEPLRRAYLNERIPGDKRATVLSFDSMIGKSGAALGLVFSGFLANTFSISVAWYTSAFVLVLGVLVFSRTKNGD